MPVQLQQIQRAYGFDAYVNVFPVPIVSNVAPVNGSDQGLNGQLWVNSTGLAAYVMVDSTTSTWQDISGGGAAFTSLTVDPGPVVINSTATTITAKANTAGVFTLTTGAGAGTTSSFNITNGTGIGLSSINLTSTAGGVNLAAGVANAAAIRLNATNAAGGITFTSLTGGLTTTSTGSISLTSALNNANALQLVASTGANATMVIQNTQGTDPASIAIASIAGGVLVNGLTNVTVNDVATCPVVSISNVAPTVDRLTFIGGQTLTAAHSDTYNIATGGVNNAGGSKIVNIATGDLTMGTQTVNIATGDAANGQALAVNIGTGVVTVGSENSINIGSTTGVSNIALNAATTDGAITGLDTITATIDRRSGVIVTSGLTTNIGSQITLTVTAATSVTTLSGIIASCALSGNENAYIEIQKIQPLNGSFVITAINGGTDAINIATNLFVSYMILS